jgi:peptidoglycan hydrolase CwlO-like protein
MPSEDVVKQLHDKATRGASLTGEEQAQLEAWYAEQDQAESEGLGLTHVSPRLAPLQAQVETTLTQLVTVTQRIQELTAQNETLRREIAALQHQLIHASTRQPA